MFGKLKAMLGLGDEVDPETVEAQRRMALDQTDPRRRWLFGLIALKHDEDPAYLPTFARTAVLEWYGLARREALVDQIRWYIAGADGTPAYDGFRGAFLARAGLGANMLTEAESWGLAVEVGRKVQRTHASWRAYGISYLEGHLAYRASQGDDHETLAGYRQELLATIGTLERGIWALPFHAPL